jgi:hypothetical protein
MYLLVGLWESLMFYSKKPKGSISFVIGLVFIVTGMSFVKLIGVIFQIYGLYEYFK